jgi:hypothetical protein
MSSSPARRRTARLLGLASLGLGTSMLVDPMRVARVAGVDDSPAALPVVTAVGARELAHAAGLLAGRPGWAWTRVLGDAVDLTAMGMALQNRHGERYERLRTATNVVAGLALLDLLVALRSRRARRTAPDLTPVTRSTTGLVAPLIDVRPALAGQPRPSLGRATEAAAPGGAARETAASTAAAPDPGDPGVTVSDVAAARMPDAP